MRSKFIWFRFQGSDPESGTENHGLNLWRNYNFALNLDRDYLIIVPNYPNFTKLKLHTKVPSLRLSLVSAHIFLVVSTNAAAMLWYRSRCEIESIMHTALQTREEEEDVRHPSTDALPGAKTVPQATPNVLHEILAHAEQAPTSQQVLIDSID